MTPAAPAGRALDRLRAIVTGDHGKTGPGHVDPSPDERTAPEQFAAASQAAESPWMDKLRVPAAAAKTNVGDVAAERTVRVKAGGEYSKLRGKRRS